MNDQLINWNEVVRKKIRINKKICETKSIILGSTVIGKPSKFLQKKIILFMEPITKQNQKLKMPNYKMQSLDQKKLIIF